MAEARTKTKLTPPELGRMWGVGPGKIVGWIRTGELRAIDASTRQGGRPRFLIDLRDVVEFEAKRAVVPPPQTKRLNRSNKKQNGVIQFF